MVRIPTQGTNGTVVQLLIAREIIYKPERPHGTGAVGACPGPTIITVLLKLRDIGIHHTSPVIVRDDLARPYKFTKL